MALLPIRLFPDPVLRTRAQEVTEFNSELHRLLDDMTETMYQAPGIGLAAPQVGVSLRVVVIDVSQDKTDRIELINPRIISNEGSRTSEEGCLSIPGFYDSLKRHKTVAVEAQDRNGKIFQISGEELLAACFQHEIDHLDGVLFVDRLSRLKKELFRRWVKKQGTLTREGLPEQAE